MYLRLARILSLALHPFLLPLYLMAILLFARTAYAAYPAGIKFYLLWVVVLFTLILPALAVAVLRSLGKLHDYRLATRRERIVPLAVGTLCCLLCALTIAKIPSALLLQRMMLAGAACEGLCLAVTLRWKISLHLTAMGAAVALFAILCIAGFGHLFWVLVAAVIASGLLASARLCLGSHNPRQILAGFAGGFAVTFLVMLFG